ncbi:hypothetical protein WICMUC_005879 [Wickerhamomyces mucosus]|uniref:NAD(+) kinase n=1 Tax=Wickerhamomyces mucosus TaxID=1378264 RepID=A0A9P8P2I4_9ASCO|nr:hypothetical protein WICMUC_005879 [Wickerhamomyces mucosus]
MSRYEDGNDGLNELRRMTDSSDNLKTSRSQAKLAETVHSVRMLSKNLSKKTVEIGSKDILIVTKARDNSLVYLTREITEWLLTKYQDLRVYVDHKLQNSVKFNSNGLIKDIPKANKCLKYWTKDFIKDYGSSIDLVITLGGDGTVLYVSSLFQRSVPPVISFSLGSLGFLTSFEFEQFRDILKIVLEKGAKTNLRMRLTCRVHRANGDLVCEQQVLNELTVDRGPSPYVSMLELYGDGSLLTVAQADGLIVATPTGSTAYSLSAGGSLIHPAVNVISVTPICAHTLSFRPILLPDSMILKVKLPKKSRSTAWAAFDGRSRVELQKGDYVNITASPYSYPTIISSSTEYFDSVSRTFNWNKREEQKPFVHLLSKKNKKNYERLISLKKFKKNLESDAENNTTEDEDDENTISYTDKGYESPPDIYDDDEEGLANYFVPPSNQALNTPPTHASLKKSGFIFNSSNSSTATSALATPTIGASLNNSLNSEGILDLSHLALEEIKKDRD